MLEQDPGDHNTPQNQLPLSRTHDGYVIGADIGGTNLRMAIADKAGTILERWSTSTAGIRSAPTVVNLIAGGVEVLLQRTGLPRNALRAIAAGAPGVTDVDKGIVIATSYLMGWQDVPLQALLEDTLGIPASVDNDVNVAAIAEHYAGAAQDISNFVFIAIGTGVGAGIMLNGQLWRGSAWTAGEIGYMLLPGTSTAPAGSDEPGAFESIVGGEGIKLQWQNRWSESSTTLPRDANPTAIFNHAQQHDSLTSDPLSCEVLDLTARTLSYAIYNIALILNCPFFVLGGGIGMHPALCAATQTHLDQRNAQVQPRLVTSTLGSDAQLIGAICLAIETAKNRSPAAQS